MNLRCKFLASTMKTRAPEDPSRFSSKCLSFPQTVSCVKESFTLGCHNTKTRRKPEQESISFDKLFWTNHRHVIWFRWSLHLL
ncbi:hypothetical protein Hanom_Chr06g00515031 [Helianthus anomalus]